MEAALAALGRFGIFSARVAWRSVTPPWNVHFPFGMVLRQRRRRRGNGSDGWLVVSMIRPARRAVASKLS